MGEVALPRVAARPEVAAICGLQTSLGGVHSRGRATAAYATVGALSHVEDPRVEVAAMYDEHFALCDSTTVGATGKRKGQKKGRTPKATGGKRDVESQLAHTPTRKFFSPLKTQ